MDFKVKVRLLNSNKPNLAKIRLPQSEFEVNSRLGKSHL